MRQTSWIRLGVLGFGLALSTLAATPASAAEYGIDLAHSSVSFKAKHMGISWVHGRFNTFSGTINFDKADPAKASFELSIKVDSVDSGNKQRNAHLANADFFDAKQFANITFKSTSVKPVKDGFEVEGDFTMHGTTRKIKFLLEGGQEAEMGPMKKIGFFTDLKLKRTDYGMDKQLPGVGDEVQVSIGLEGNKK